MVPLTRRQRLVIEFINARVSETGVAPTHAEVAQRFGISVAAVGGHISRMEQRGAIKRIHGAARGITVIGGGGRSFVRLDPQIRNRLQVMAAKTKTTEEVLIREILREYVEVE